MNNIAQFETLGNMPDVNPESHYLSAQQEHADLTGAVNENITKNQNDLKAHYDQIAKIYDHQYNQKSKDLDNLLKLTKRGVGTVQQLGKWQEWEKDFSRRSDKYNQTASWARYDKEEDVYKQYQLHSDVNRKQRIEAAAELQDEGDIDGKILLTTTDDDILSQTVMGDMKQVVSNFKVVYNYLNESLPINFTELHGRKNEYGKDDIRPAAEAKGKEERLFRDGKIFSIYMGVNEHLALGRRGQYKANVRNPILKQLEVIENANWEAHRKADITASKQNRHSVLLDRILEDPSYLSDHLQIYKDSTDSRSWAEIKRDTFSALGDYASVGRIRRDQANAIGDTEFHAHDSTPENPHLVTAREYWKEDFKLLTRGVQTFEKAQYEEVKGDWEAKLNASAAETKLKWDKEKDQSPENMNRYITEYMSKNGLTDPRLVPDILKNLPYEGQADDGETLADLMNKEANLLPITKADVARLNNPDLKAQWLKKVTSGLSQADVKRRDSFIVGKVNKKTLETDGNKDKSDKWRAYKDNATIAFNRKFLQAKLNGASDEEAFTAAQDAVKAGLLDEDWSEWGGQQQDLNTSRSVSKAKNILSQDPKLINAPNYLPGEEAVLNKAIKTWDPENPEVPYYYKELALNIKNHDGYKVMLERMKILGLLKDGVPSIPAEENLKPNQARLLSNRPNSSRTYRVTQDNKDLVWMLEQVQDPTALNNGGYDAVRNQEGEYTELEKPLSQHTVREILGLIQDGHDDFGVYGITATGFLDVLEANNVSLDSVFDQNTQDLLVLGRLRQKSQQAQQYSTINNQYRRLVNISTEDEEEFLRIVGDIPPYLRLSNLLPAVATEMVNQTLQ